MRHIRYSVAASLDGFIAGPNGEFDWIPMDPDIDFQAIFAELDTLLMGRKTYEAVKDGKMIPGMKTYVFSRTLDAAEHPGVTVIGEGGEATVRGLKEAPGKGIWLFGGGLLFRSLAEAGLVDAVEVAVVPIVLGGGIPLIAPGAGKVKLELREQKVYEKTGIVMLSYAVLS